MNSIEIFGFCAIIYAFIIGFVSGRLTKKNKADSYFLLIVFNTFFLVSPLIIRTTLF